MPDETLTPELETYLVVLKVKTAWPLEMLGSLPFWGEALCDAMDVSRVTAVAVDPEG